MTLAVMSSLPESWSMTISSCHQGMGKEKVLKGLLQPTSPAQIPALQLSCGADDTLDSFSKSAIYCPKDIYSPTTPCISWEKADKEGKLRTEEGTFPCLINCWMTEGQRCMSTCVPAR